MIGTAPPFDCEHFPCPDILNFERCAFRNLFTAAVKPVEPFRGSASSVRIGRIRLFRVRGIQFGKRLAVDFSIGCQAVSFLKILYGCLLY